jgi:HSP90 family molecular chaperone
MRTTNIVQKSQSDREVGTSAIAMTIDEASSVFLMDALGKLYSRPAQAVLREYLSNAIDAHKAKGGKLPAIQITLPEGNTRNPSGSSMLIIRDFGKGMNEEEFGSILSRYGASTKRDSNAMIGGFGLGAKSGFAVSDEFFMTSYQQGRGLRVRIFKDALNQGYIDVIDRFTNLTV